MKKSQAAILGALIVLWGVWASSAYKNKSMHALQSKLEQEINKGLETANTLPLDAAGGVAWDYVCFVSYDSTGAEEADGARVAQEALRGTGLDFSAFSSVNRTYNALSKDWTHGLVFASAQQKLLVAISLDDIGGAARPEEVCARAQNAALSVTEKTDDSRSIAFTGSLK